MENLKCEDQLVDNLVALTLGFKPAGCQRLASLRYARYVLIALHVRFAVTCLVLSRTEKPSLVARHQVGLYSIMGDLAVRPVCVSLVVLFTASLAIGYITWRQSRQFQTSHDFISLNRVVHQLMTDSETCHVIRNIVNCWVVSYCLMLTTVVSIDAIFHSPATVLDRFVLCFGFICTVVSILVLVIQWIFIFIIFYKTLSLLSFRFDQTDRSLKLLLSVRHIIRKQSFLYRYDILLSHYTHLYRIVGCSPVVTYWGHVAFAFVICYLVQSTYILFSNIFLVQNLLANTILYLILIPFSLPSIGIILLMRNFNMRLIRSYRLLGYSSKSRAHQDHDLDWLRHKMKIDRLLETMTTRESCVVGFKVGLLEKQVTGSIILAIMIKQARNFILLIKSHLL